MEKTQLRRLLAISTGLVALPALYAVSTAAPADKSKVRYEGLPFEIRDVNGEKPVEVRVWKNGRMEFEQTVKVQVDGKTTHGVVAKGKHADQASGGKLLVEMTDTDSKESSSFGYDPSKNAMTIAAGGSTTTITKNPDGGYQVDGKEAKSGKAAVALLRQTAAYKATSPHAKLLAYSYGQATLPEVKAPTNCNYATTNLASKPSVCSIFKAVCDCMACDASTDVDKCQKCR